MYDSMYWSLRMCLNWFEICDESSVVVSCSIFSCSFDLVLMLIAVSIWFRPCSDSCCQADRLQLQLSSMYAVVSTLWIQMSWMNVWIWSRECLVSIPSRCCQLCCDSAIVCHCSALVEGARLQRCCGWLNVKILVDVSCRHCMILFYVSLWSRAGWAALDWCIAVTRRWMYQCVWRNQQFKTLKSVVSLVIRTQMNPLVWVYTDEVVICSVLWFLTFIQSGFDMIRSLGRWLD